MPYKRVRPLPRMTTPIISRIRMVTVRLFRAVHGLAHHSGSALNELRDDPTDQPVRQWTGHLR